MDGNGNALYQIYLEIRASGNRYGYNGPYNQAYYDYGYEPVIMASLSDYLAIVDNGTIDIQIPYTVMQSLCGARTYDVFMRLEDQANDDARQLIVGKLPVLFGGIGP